MNILEYADILNLQIVIRYYPNQKKRFCVSFENVEVKGDGVLIGQHGNGPSPKEAVDEYVRSIQGKIIVVNAYKNGRLEYEVPKDLVGLP